MTERTLGSYRLLAELGTGGMGTVHLAETADGGQVALKVVHAHLLASPSFLDRFEREARIGRRVRHPNVVRTIDVEVAGSDRDPVHFLVMEYVEGQTLRDLLEELGQVPEELCRHVGREIARALTAIHDAGAIHRDLKPENVLITKDHVVKVMDLGVARLVDEAIRLSQTGAFAGSVLYAAPEQFQGSEPDGRCDLYALGLLLYELATGRHPSRGDDFAQTMQRRLNEEVRPPSALNTEISAFFEEVLCTLLARDPDARFATAAEVAEILDLGEKSSWWMERSRTLRAAAPRQPRRIRIERETPLHGRDAEIGRLDGMFDRVRAGEGQVMLVEGEAGIGKTRLVDEFVEHLRAEGTEVHFLFAGYPPGGAATLAAAFAVAFRDHFGREGLEQTLARYLRQTPILIPAFAALLRGEPMPPGQEPLTQDSIQTVFVHALRALASERPTILLIDDLQFAPQEGLALFAALALVAAEHRVLLVGATRPGLPEQWVASLDRLPHAARIHLARLGPKDLARVLIDAFASERLAQELGLQIAQKSDGNPFFVFEIIRGLREGRLIERLADGSWVKTQVIEDIQIPSSILDLLQARIADLEEEERDLVDVASCCGFEFDPLLVAAALGMEQIPAMKRFARIEKRHRLIRSSGRSCVFDHHQIQQALYNGMAELLREPYHAALAEALERRERGAERELAELGGALCVELCNHFLKGGKPERAKRYLAAALDHLQTNYLNDAAVRLADRALAAGTAWSPAERIDLLLRKAERLDLLGRRQREHEELEKARAVAEGLPDPAPRARVWLQMGTYLTRAAEYPRAQECLERARGLSREAGDLRLEAEIESHLGSIWHNLGIYARAQEHYERTLALALTSGDPDEETRARLSLGHVFTELGQADRSREQIDHVLRLTDETGNRRWKALARCHLGDLELQVGNFRDARRNLERSLMLAHEIGVRAGVTTAIGRLGVTFRSLGKLLDARQHFERYLMLAREIGSRRDEADALASLGALQIVLGMPTRARDTLGTSLAVSREIGVRRTEAFAIHGLAALAEVDGDRALALHHHEEALAILRDIGNRRDEAELLLDVGRLRLERGERAAARGLAEDALRLATDLTYPTGILLSSAYLALLDSTTVAPALQALEEHGPCATHLARLSAHYVLWQATRDRAQLGEAYRHLSHMHRFAPRENRTAMVARVPLHRAILTAARKNGF